jgi:hypothetical protein
MLFYNIMHQFIIDNQSNMHIYFGMLAWFHDFCVHGTLRTRYTTLDGRRAACLCPSSAATALLVFKCSARGSQKLLYFLTALFGTGRL